LSEKKLKKLKTALPVWAAAALITAASVFLALRFACAALAGAHGAPAATVLVYHDFREGPSDDAGRFTGSGEFAAHLEYLRQNGYCVVPLKSVIRFLEDGEPLPPKAVAITFDDGYLGNYTVAFPLLKEYGAPATVFVVAGLNEVKKPYDGHEWLTWEMLREMQQSGLVDVQSHTYDLHYKVFTGPDRKRLRPAAVARAYRFDLGRRETPEEFEEKLYLDLLKARQTIEAQLGTPVDTLAWPFGAYTPKSLEVARRAGYRYFATTLPGANAPGVSPQAVRRVSVRAGTGTAELGRLLNYAEFYRENWLRFLAGYLDYLKDTYLGW